LERSEFLFGMIPSDTLYLLGHDYLIFDATFLNGISFNVLAWNGIYIHL